MLFFKNQLISQQSISGSAIRYSLFGVSACRVLAYSEFSSLTFQSSRLFVMLSFLSRRFNIHHSRFNIMSYEPLAQRLRPRKFEDLVGQEHLVAPGKPLRELIEQDKLSSIILYGPPGTGKTTLAHLIAEKSQADFVTMSAVTAGVPELKKIIERAKLNQKMNRKTILFIDEIHRFNKRQQDALLPVTEDGTIVLIGATTENPSFEVISALLSRSQVFVLKSLSTEALGKILIRACAEQKISLSADGQQALLEMANGDARILLNLLESAANLNKGQEITAAIVAAASQKTLRYDKNGEEHYNIISALHKSMRDSDPDGALYWLGRMLEAGEEPLYIARRLIRFASEDIGNTDPHALLVAVAAYQACHFIGMPECNVNLAQAVTHLSLAPKSNALYLAYNEVRSDIEKFGNLPVPLHLRNAPTKLMKDWGYGKDYKYAHNFKDAKVDQKHLPEKLKNKQYYHPTEQGLEKRIKEKMETGDRS